MNTEWAIKELETFSQQSARVPIRTPGVVGMRYAASEGEIAAKSQVIEQILDRITPRWRATVPASPVPGDRWRQHREAALRAREALARAAELRHNLGESAPELSAAELHPWIWSGASSLWQSGHYREAVEGAIKKLNAETQNKVGRRDVSETDLFKQAFSMDDAKPGKARLRRMKDDGSDTYKSVQRGAMTFAEGVFAGIRNPLTHESNEELSEQEALEYLAALSVLARWVDQSLTEASA